MALAVSSSHGMSVCPQTSSLLFLGLLGHTLASSHVGSLLLGKLWWARGKTACHPSSSCAFGRVLGMGSQWRNPYVLGSTFPRFIVVLPWGSSIVVHSLGQRSRPTLPHREAKVSVVGFPCWSQLKSWHSRVMRVVVEGVGGVEEGN